MTITTKPGINLANMTKAEISTLENEKETMYKGAFKYAADMANNFFGAEEYETRYTIKDAMTDLGTEEVLVKLIYAKRTGMYNIKNFNSGEAEIKVSFLGNTVTVQSIFKGKTTKILPDYDTFTLQSYEDSFKSSYTLLNYEEMKFLLKNTKTGDDKNKETKVYPIEKDNFNLISDLSSEITNNYISFEDIYEYHNKYQKNHNMAK